MVEVARVVPSCNLSDKTGPHCGTGPPQVRRPETETFADTANGGGGGSRTRVPRAFIRGIYMLS